MPNPFLPFRNLLQPLLGSMVTPGLISRRRTFGAINYNYDRVAVTLPGCW
jgi:hypothetical protein